MVTQSLADPMRFQITLQPETWRKIAYQINSSDPERVGEALERAIDLIVADLPDAAWFN